MSIIFVLDFKITVSFRHCSYIISSQLELCAAQERARTKAILDKHHYHQRNSFHYEEFSDEILMYISSYNLLPKLLILTPIVSCCVCVCLIQGENQWNKETIRAEDAACYGTDGKSPSSTHQWTLPSSTSKIDQSKLLFKADNSTRHLWKAKEGCHFQTSFFNFLFVLTEIRCRQSRFFSINKHDSNSWSLHSTQN